MTGNIRNNRNNLKLDEVLEELYHLREENQDLKLENDFLQRKAALLKGTMQVFTLREIQDAIIKANKETNL